MPFFASLIALIFGQIFEYFAKFITRKIAFYTALVATLTALTAGLYLAVQAILLTLYVTFPIPAGTIYAFLPSNTALCFSAYGSALILKWTYDWNAGLIQKNLFL